MPASKNERTFTAHDNTGPDGDEDARAPPPPQTSRDAMRRRWIALEHFHDAGARLADVIVGVAVLTVGLPVLIALGVAVRLDSTGPVLFVQRRVGRGREPFALVKFRTMMVGTVQAGTHEVSASSVTRLGAKLRHYKLDELPQAWNLLIGNLTLVGPRPCLPTQTRLIEERERRGVYSLKPGVTGLAQVNGIDMSDPIRLAECDAAYAAGRGIWSDIVLLWKTLGGTGSGDRVIKDDV